MRRLDKSNQLSANSPRRNTYSSQGDRKREASGSSTARIHEKNAIAFLDFGMMGMASDDRTESGARRVKIELGKIVEQVERGTSNFDHLGGGKRLCPHTLVIVATNGDNWSELAKAVKHMRRADIAGVHDELAPGKSSDGLRPEKPVRVRDDPNDSVRAFHFWATSGAA